MTEIYIDDFDVVKDGITNDAPMFQKAIDYLETLGGGTLYITKGNYALGTIVLKSNITLYLEEGAFLKMASDLSLFTDGTLHNTLITRPTYEDCSYDGRPLKYFIVCKHATNIKILGSGIIDGNEEIFYGQVTKWHIEGAFYPRIPLLFFEDVTNLEIKDITIQKSAFWTVHLVGSKDIYIKGIKIYNNLRMVNSDGIDPDHCQNVLIEDVYIEAADDCIVLKTTEGFNHYGNTENIVVRDSTLMSTSAAIKVGSESVSDFNNLKFENIKILSSNRGISLQLRDKGNISNAIFKNIKIETRLFSPNYWWGKSEAIAITAVRRSVDKKVGTISNITFQDIKAKGENGIFLYSEDNNIFDIKFKNINLKMQKTTDWSQGLYDIRPHHTKGLFEDKISFIYIYQASNIKFKKCHFKLNDNLKAAQYILKNSDDIIIK